MWSDARVTHDVYIPKFTCLSSLLTHVREIWDMEDDTHRNGKLEGDGVVFKHR